MMKLCRRSSVHRPVRQRGPKRPPHQRRRDRRSPQDRDRNQHQASPAIKRDQRQEQEDEGKIDCDQNRLAGVESS